MSKYIVFGWSENSKHLGPADELLGTTSAIDAEEHDYGIVEFEGQNVIQFGHKLVERPVELTPPLMRGKTFDMTVLVSYGADGIANARPVLAWYKVPGTDDG